ncbi:hypothetical protein H4217_002857 [Coemansia sp. RSA 1939]|nr:hypothetical protein H4217_002857 [Coemansia sp. RSA 1939]KAJ2618153.1 hypothetical protein EV177_000189 [Coemansia sp. RSA 1804]
MSSYTGYAALFRHTMPAWHAAGSSAIWAATRQATHVSSAFGKPNHLLLAMQRGTKQPKYHLSSVPDYEEKYRAQLMRRAREKGVDSVEDLKRLVKEQEQQQQQQQQQQKHADGGSVADQSGRTQTRNSSETSRRAEPLEDTRRVLDRSSNASASNLPPDVKSLDQIMRLDKLGDKTSEEISEIWTAFHTTKDCISAAIPASTYRDLLAVARKNPLFIIPLPRDQGIEFFFLQFDYHRVHFTPLIEYKTNTVNARPLLTLTHYTDLADSKGLVLMRGELEGRSNALLDSQNAQYLALQLQQFYVTGGPEKRALLERFNQKPESFDYNELVQAAQKL